MPPELFCSVIIPTIGRDTLTRTVESALNQVCSQPFEVIVVNDSGRPLPAANWQQRPAVQIIETTQRERSAARNAGAGVARGRYLNFLDDDDWLLPGALETFAGLADRSPAAWLYGASQLTDTNGRCLYQFDHQLRGNCLTQVLAGEWVPLQASIIKENVFWAVGAFPNNSHSAQDKDLLLQVALHDELFGTSTPVAGILRGVWLSSTDPDLTFPNWRAACERVLSAPGAAGRLRASAGSAYWQGRVLRAYLISTIWNMQQGHLITMSGRLFHAAGALARGGSRWLSADFWRALTRTHLTQGFEPPALPKAQADSPPEIRPAG